MELCQLFFFLSCTLAMVSAAAAAGASAAPLAGLHVRYSSSVSTATVRVVPNFLSKLQIEQHLREESRYALVPNDFPGNRTWGTAHLSPAFLRRVLTDGAEQCPSADFEAGLPASAVGILTNHVTETTRPHLDCNPATKKPVEASNDVAVVFLNSNEDATFIVGREAFAVEEGSLFIFPGGTVPHFLEIERSATKTTELSSSFVQMLGPFEVDGSHGIVMMAPNLDGLGNAGPLDRQCVSDDGVDCDYKAGDASIEGTNRERNLQEGNTPDSSAASETAEAGGRSEFITGNVRITGYREGMTPDGAANQTIEVWYDIGGLEPALEFRIEMEDGPTSFCNDVQPGQVDADYPDLQSSEVADSIWHQVASTSDSDGRSQGFAYVDVGFAVEELFDHPVVLYKSDDTALACGILKALVESSAASTQVGADDSTASPSPPSAGLAPWTRFLFVCCLFAGAFI